MPTHRRLRALSTAPGALLALLAVAVPAGAISARNYGATFASHEADARACYAAAHVRAASSTLHATYHVANTGRLDAWTVTAPVDPALAPVAACIAQRARTWHFEPSTSGGSREVTFTFAPGAPVAIH